MTKKEIFINEINAFIEEKVICLTDDAMVYFQAMQESDTEKPPFTANGARILKFMKENVSTYNNLFKAKEVADAMGISSKAVSGGSRKLVTDGYLEKVGNAPVIYAVTEKGFSAEVTLPAED